jgi:hypothetical protein
MAFSCGAVRGLASGSDLAAARIALPSSKVGIRTVGFLDVPDIVLDLARGGPTQTDDPSNIPAIDEGDVIEDPGPGRQRDHA